jgi:hypothetical protein
MFFVSVIFVVSKIADKFTNFAIDLVLNCALRLRSTSARISAAQANFTEVSKQKLQMFQSGDLWDCVITVGSSKFFYQQVCNFKLMHLLEPFYTILLDSIAV